MAGGSRSISSIGVTSTTWLPYSPMLSEIAPALRRTPPAPGHRIGEPEKPGPIPVASTAGPDARTRIRGPESPACAPITSITSTSNCEIAVPRTTDSPTHCMPGRTCVSGMIGSAARAAGASARATRADNRTRRSKGAQPSGTNTEQRRLRQYPSRP